MLNSRYAPVVALAVLGVVLVGVLGWFLAIKPQFDTASDLSAREDAVSANTDKVRSESAKLDEYAALLAEDESVSDAIALNAPSVIDLPAFRARLSAALTASGSELVGVEQQSTISVDGWQITASALVSNQVATLFQDGPVGETAGSGAPQPAEAASAGTDSSTTETATASGWSPVISPTTEDGPVADAIMMLPFEIQIAGTPQEAYAFMVEMSRSTDQMFQVYALTQEARQSDAGGISGVSDPNDGDVLTTVTGSLYLLNPDRSIIDEGELVTVPQGDDAFLDTPEAEPQAGAN